MSVFLLNWSPSSIQVLSEGVTGQLKLLILVAPCWVEASWLPTDLKMLVDISHCCPNVQNLVMDV